MNESNAMALANESMGAVDWDGLHARSRATFDTARTGSSLALHESRRERREQTVNGRTFDQAIAEMRETVQHIKNAGNNFGLKINQPAFDVWQESGPWSQNIEDARKENTVRGKTEQRTRLNGQLRFGAFDSAPDSSRALQDYEERDPAELAAMRVQASARRSGAPQGPMRLADEAMGSIDWAGLRDRATAGFDAITRGFSSGHAKPGKLDLEPAAFKIARGARAVGERFMEGPPSFDWGALQGPSGERDDPMRGRQAESTVPLAAGLMGGGTAFAPRGSLGIFGGRLAQTADHAALAKAEEMVAKGAPREQIWNETGWFKGADGEWRFEIPDNKAQLTGLPLKKDAQRVSASDQMLHPELYEAYPETSSIGLKAHKGGYGGTYYEPRATNPTPFIDVSAKNVGEGTSIGAHEMQHHVQYREKFAQGGNPSDPALKNKFHNPEVAAYEHAVKNDPRMAKFLGFDNNPEFWSQQQAKNAVYAEKYEPRLKPYLGNNSITAARKRQEILQEMLNEQSGKYPLVDERSNLIAAMQKDGIPVYPPSKFLTGDEAYRHLAGEVEARNVQARLPMTPEQRKAAPPWTTEDVPAGKQIVMHADGTMASRSVAAVPQAPGPAGGKMAQPEKVDWAAIKVGDKTFKGGNHFAAGEAAAKELGIPIEKVMDLAHDGFLTTTGRFIDRAEAGRLVDAVGQSNTHKVLRAPELHASEVNFPRTDTQNFLHWLKEEETSVLARRSKELSGK